MDIKVGQGAEFKNNDDARNMANILVRYLADDNISFNKNICI